MSAQKTLGFGKATGKNNTARTHGYDEANLRSAREILSQVDQYGGSDSFSVIWARTVIARLGPEATA